MAYSEQTVTSVHQWSDKTFSLKTTRPPDFNFRNGEFVTLGLRIEGKLIPRAYSIVSPNEVDHLEFLSIYIPDGPLTSHLVRIHKGDSVWINKKTTGSLTLAHVRPGRRLFLIATGTGIAPFISLIRAESTFESFEKVILVHSVRTMAELAYKDEIELLDSERLLYMPTVTREPYATQERGADLFRSGELFTRLGIPAASPDEDSIMLCGNPEMNKEMTEYLEQQGWVQTSHRGIGNFTTEKAFVVRK